MKRVSFIGIILTLSLSFVHGQMKTDSIIIKKSLGAYQFYQNGKRLRMSQLVTTMQSNELAYKEIKAAQSNYTFATVIGGAGGFMVGWPIGAAVAGGDPNWTLAAIGAGLIVVSIPISQKSKKQAQQAVETYNGGLTVNSFWDKTDLRFAFSGNGLGLVLEF